MARWWFVRHGESVANAGRWLAGHRDVPLTDVGVAQARSLATQLAAISPDRVLSSDLERAWQTAALAWDQRRPPCQRTPLLRERSLGRWEGAALADLANVGAMPVLWSWDRRPPMGESHRDLARRALGALSDLDDGADTLIFAHGGWIRTAVGVLDGTPYHEIGKNRVANTQVIERTAPRGAWERLRSQLE